MTSSLLMGISSLNGLGSFWLALTIKASVILLLALAITSLMKRSSPSARHAVWTLAFLIVLFFPLIYFYAPSWNPGVITIHSNQPPGNEGLDEFPVLDRANRMVRNLVDNNPVSSRGASGQLVVDFQFDHIRKESAALDAVFGFVGNNGASLLIGLWLLGFLFVLVRHAGSRLILKGIVLSSEEIAEQEWHSLWIALRRKAGLSRPVQLFRNSEVVSPLTAGFVYPRIIVPAEADQWDSEHKKYVLQHELAHIKRWDAVSQAIAYIACGMLWFNPIAWFAYRQMIKERELACDQYVVEGGSQASDYAEFLLMIARKLPSLRLATVATVPMAKTSQLEGRLMSILNPEPARGMGTRLAAGLAILLFTTTAFPVATFNPFVLKKGAGHRIDSEEIRAFNEQLSPPGDRKGSAAAVDLADLKKQRADSIRIASRYFQQYTAALDSSLEVRLGTVWSFLENNRYAGKALSAALSDPEWEIRKIAAWALGQLNEPGAVSPLIEAAGDVHRDVRHAAVEALGKIKSPQAIPALSSALEDEHWWIRRRAAWALGEIADSSAVNILGRFVKDNNAKVRQEVIDSLGKLKDRRAVPFILQAMNDESSDVREVAVTALDELGDTSVLPLLHQALSDKSSGVRAEAAETMGELGDPGAIPYLAEALKDRDDDVREKAAWALGELGNIGGISLLSQALGDPEEDVRVEAIRALAKINSDQVLPLIEPLLKDDDDDVRKSAAIALGDIGSLRALPSLNQSVKDQDIKVSWEAAKAIQKIRKKSGS